MTILELRTEIYSRIDDLPESLLLEVLNHIKMTVQREANKEDIMQFIGKVFKEDDGLLKRLAE